MRLKSYRNRYVHTTVKPLRYYYYYYFPLLPLSYKSGEDQSKNCLSARVCRPTLVDRMTGTAFTSKIPDSVFFVILGGFSFFLFFFCLRGHPKLR